jgi:hypothetical protein
MPIITKPSPLEKDATGVFSLDKTALALHPIVVASSHFSSPNVWDKIIVKYKSETLGQFESIEFDASLASPEGQFFVSETAEDIFEVEKITIIDKDGAILLIPRAELTVAEFDIDFGYVPPVGSQTVTWNVAGKTGAGTVTAGANGLITKSTGGSNYNVNVLSNETITGDGYVEFVISASFINVVFGLAEVNSPTGSFNNLIIGCYRTSNTGWLEGVVTAGNLAVNFGNFLPIGPTQNGDVVKIARVGTTYSMQKNNGVVYSTTINNTNPLKASATIYGETYGVNDLTISP